MEEINVERSENIRQTERRFEGAVRHVPQGMTALQAYENKYDPAKNISITEEINRIVPSALAAVHAGQRPRVICTCQEVVTGVQQQLGHLASRVELVLP